MRSPVTGIATLIILPAQNDAGPAHALPHQPPQSDQKLARQGHDHGSCECHGRSWCGLETTAARRSPSGT